MKVLVIDNYDSFAYNLVQYVGEVVTTDGWLPEVTDGEVVVRRNDEITLEEIDDLDPDAIVVSPGPGTPQEAGISIPLFEARTYPTLGVCLGHQALCAANGGDVGHADSVVHGKPSTVSHDGRGIFEGLPDQFDVGRYHSLAVDRDGLPAALVETARTEDEETVVMGVRHERYPHVGVQFHPESILTAEGMAIIENFLQQYVLARDGGEGRDGGEAVADGGTDKSAGREKTETRHRSSAEGRTFRVDGDRPLTVPVDGTSGSGGGASESNDGATGGHENTAETGDGTPGSDEGTAETDDKTAETDEWSLVEGPVGFRCSSGTWKEREWTGIPVLDLLDAAAIPDETTHVQFESREGDRACVPLSDLEDGIVAVGDADGSVGESDGLPRLVSPDIVGPRTLKNLAVIRPLVLAADENREGYERLPFEE